MLCHQETQHIVLELRQYPRQFVGPETGCQLSIPFHGTSVQERRCKLKIPRIEAVLSGLKHVVPDCQAQIPKRVKKSLEEFLVRRLKLPPKEKDDIHVRMRLQLSPSKTSRCQDCDLCLRFRQDFDRISEDLANDLFEQGRNLTHDATA